MNAAVWMAGTTAAVWLVAAPFLDSRARVEVLLGMLGPVLVASGSWLLTERTYRQRPEALTSVMIASFAFKLVFFGAYVAVMLRVLTLRPVPFVLSFAGSLAGLYLMEALYLRRLFR